MIEQPDPKHRIPEGLKPQEVYKGVPILAFQDDDMLSDEYGLSLVWYEKIVDIGHARLGKPYLDLVQDAKNAIDILLELEELEAKGEEP